jgi:hypothetical protein
MEWDGTGRDGRDARAARLPAECGTFCFVEPRISPTPTPLSSIRNGMIAATATLVDFRPLRAVQGAAIPHNIEVTLTGPSVRQLLKRPEYAWVAALRPAKSLYELPTESVVLDADSEFQLQEGQLYEMVPRADRKR